MSFCVFNAPVINNTIKQEINELVESIKLERRKYNEYQIIKNVVSECAKETCELSTELRSKIHNILMTTNLQSLGLANNTLLGLDLNMCELTYEEKENLKGAVQQRLMEKRCNIIKELLELGITVDNDDWSTKSQSALSLSAQETVLMDLKSQLNRKQELYSKLLQEFVAVLEQIIDLKIKILPEATDQKIQACNVQSKLLLLRAEIIHAKSRVNIFAETGTAMDAYKELLRDVLQQQTECKQDLEKLHELKEKYKQVSCKQYDEILKSYLQYKSRIEKKKLFDQ